jgi:Arc/MetJ-type ribon-helix-helix transcriptional regulator
MKKKVFTRPVSVTMSDEMFDQVKAITDQGQIGLSDYIRAAIREKLDRETINPKNNK